ncbi:hypothetical protein FB45DRAFT_989334 [Roridomyces roridus]|uniref:phosphatidylinositol-3,4,5-trisphosphate 3-phosphatase n=1 Tax=Roridomyces roridus TaxID=1738132 RepID=A0AAD7C2E9_9AGAR|nr:hypothetical protein FB45DRAFT_989334 [Roridomyces roridus]
MTDYIRRLVSGNKARFKDTNLNLELDLVYLTDRIIIMGYPAEGLESFYRNDRDANFWVFNFCPMRENSYSASFFDGRVSRYPFPDHHAPPLAIMPLAAREMAEWLDGSPDRVIVLHCKAGKGRSGTLACTYLLSCDEAPKLQRSPSASEWAEIRTNEVIKAIEHEDATVPLETVVESPKPTSKTFPDLLKDVLDLHTARRMKPANDNETSKPGVSIPSQRRWLHYWALLLGHAAPDHLWSSPSPRAKPKVRLTRITLRMHEVGAMKLNLVRAATAVIDRANIGKSGSTVPTGRGPVWVSLARYNDELVGLLEKWEAHTRHESGKMGKKRKGSESMDGHELRETFDDKGKWDGKKMVRSFARLGATGDEDSKKTTTEDGKLLTYTLHPLTESGWVHIRDQLSMSESVPKVEELEVDVPPSEANSMYDVTQSAKERGVVLDAGREVRVKVYMGQIFMCWIWLIPTFHMPQPPPAPGEAPPPPTKITLTRKECDFPVGVGSAIVDVEIEMEWLKGTDVEGVQPAARQSSAESAGEPAGIAATLEAVAEGSLSGAVETKQAAED